MTAGFGGWLKGAIRRAGISQRDLAGRIGVQDRTVSRWVRQDVHVHHVHLDALADALGVTRREVYEAAGRMDEYPGERVDQPSQLAAYVRALRSQVDALAAGLADLERSILRHEDGASGDS